MTTYSSSNKPQNQNTTAIVVTIAVLLLALIGYLAYNSITKARQLEQTVSELEESEKLRQELETQYNAALADLEAQKTNNQELNALIEQQKAELEQQRRRISELIGSRDQLQKARAELNNLRAQVKEYLAQIEKLKAENEMLSAQNEQLSGEKERLSTELQAKSEENQNLQTIRSQLVAEKEQLASKVSIASVIKMREVKAVGQRVRNSGKAVDTDRAKRVDQIKVCFTALDNDVVQPGTETFLIRIINPKGETLAVEDMGSGNFRRTDTGEEVRFTMLSEVDYNNDEVTDCLIWAPVNPSFIAGEYTVEVYNKGYLAGVGKFKLK
ncbi:MAG: hypothetical protein KatS3mg029_0612 [Saprospiraceae bacterium]|nr:MAG: hypothetical protein KatS3mg029_0612 [Saprospiraceae bacterium]